MPSISSPSSSTQPASRSLDLIEAKLSIPSLRAETVVRSRLVERLQASPAPPVVSVIAPAGYGKSTLLALWADSDHRAFGWLTVDQRDNDPIVFLSHLAGTLDQIEPVGKRLISALRAPHASLFGTVVPRLGTELSALDEPIVLVMDDIHEVDQQVCLDALAVLARHLPEGSQLVLAGRRAPALPLARYRSEGALLELDAADLALNGPEAGQLLRAAGIDLSDPDVDDLNNHAEGWAAGLYLAALAMVAAGTAPDVSRFSGEDRFVTDYLRTELLSSLPPKEMEFLTRTSVLERMCAPLCDAVLAGSRSARRLEEIERANLLLVPLDHERTWYRYHHLFRDMLQAELSRREPELVTELHLRAATWFEQNGHADCAVSHAAAAGDLDRVSRLVAQYTTTAYRAGRSATVERWFALLDDPATLGGHPAAALLGAMFHALMGRTADAVRWLEAISPASRKVEAVQQGIASVEALMCRHGVEAMLSDAELGAAGDPSSAENLHLIAVARLLAGDEEGAGVVFGEALQAARTAGGTHVALLSLSELALLALTRGELEVADRHLLEARRWIDDAGVDGYTTSALVHAAAARVALRRGDLVGARASLVAAHRVRPQLTDAIPWYSVQVRLELARTHLALTERDAALTLLSEARDVLGVRPDLGVLGAQVEELAARVAAVDDPVAVAWAASLTVAELRLLPLLTTHLTFREIAERLFVSRNTVKTQAISVYRKLGVTSRSEAITRATELGLIGG